MNFGSILYKKNNIFNVTFKIIFFLIILLYIFNYFILYFKFFYYDLSFLLIYYKNLGNFWSFIFRFKAFKIIINIISHFKHSIINFKLLIIIFIFFKL